MNKRAKLDSPVHIYHDLTADCIIIQHSEDRVEVLSELPSFPILVSKAGDNVVAAASLKTHYKAVRKPPAAWRWQDDPRWNYKGVGLHAAKRFSANLAKKHPMAKSLGVPENTFLFLYFGDAEDCPIYILGDRVLVYFQDVSGRVKCLLAGISAGGLVQMACRVDHNVKHEFFAKLLEHPLIFFRAEGLNQFKKWLEDSGYVAGPSGKYHVLGKTAPILEGVGELNLAQSSLYFTLTTKGVVSQLWYQLYLITVRYESPMSPPWTSTIELAFFVFLYCEPGILTWPTFVGGLEPSLLLPIVAYPNPNALCHVNTVFRLLQGSDILIRVLAASSKTSNFAADLQMLLSPAIISDYHLVEKFVRVMEGWDDSHVFDGGYPEDFIATVATQFVQHSGFAPFKEIINELQQTLICLSCGQYRDLPTQNYDFALRPNSPSHQELKAHLAHLVQQGKKDFLIRMVRSTERVEMGDLAACCIPTHEECPVNCGAPDSEVYSIISYLQEVPEPRIFTLPRELLNLNTFTHKGGRYQVVMRNLFYKGHVRNLIYKQDVEQPFVLVDDDASVVLTDEQAAQNLRVNQEYQKIDERKIELVLAYPTDAQIPYFDYFNHNFIHPSNVPQRLRDLYKTPLPRLMSQLAWEAHIKDAIKQSADRLWGDV